VLRENCTRLGLRTIVPIRGDIRRRSEWLDAIARELELHDAAPLFDRILLDAPCSGLGVLRRHPDAKWRKQTSSLARHRQLQLQLLESVAPCLRPGGVLVYSTCSTEPEETTSVIEQFLSAHAGFRRESAAPWLPPRARIFLTERGELVTQGHNNSMDGFYAARLRKLT
jgi:16S rRNA (cytosine967-C5)-methyltransferase